MKLTPFVGQFVVTHLLYKSPLSVQRIKTVQWPKHFHTQCISFSFFCGTRSLHHRLRLRKRFVKWHWLLSGSTLSHLSLVQSPLSIQRIKTAQWPKHFHTHFISFFPFLVGPSLCITDSDSGRDLLDEHDSFVGELTIFWVYFWLPLLKSIKSISIQAYYYTNHEEKGWNVSCVYILDS